MQNKKKMRNTTAGFFLQIKQKSKLVKVICTTLTYKYVQLICKKNLPIMKTVDGIVCTKEIPFQHLITCHFPVSITLFFLWKTQLTKMKTFLKQFLFLKLKFSIKTYILYSKCNCNMLSINPPRSNLTCEN